MNFYSKISKILNEIENNKISFKNAIYKYIDYNKDQHFKKTYKLVIEVLKHKKIIHKIINQFFESEGEVIKDPNFFMVLIYEKFFSDQKKKIGGKLMRILKEKEEFVRKFIQENKTDNDDDDSNSLFYFRINQQKENNEILKFIQENQEIKKDNLIKGLYSVEKTRENDEIIRKLFLRKENAEIIIQTKSSCIPAYLLKKVIESDNKLSKEKFDIIDSCSAPGNKTLQLSEYFNKSKISAFEINPKRFELLKQNVNAFNFNENIEPVNEDFLSTDPNDKKFSKIKAVLADPSCSGSGTAHNSLIDYQDGDENILKKECSVSISGSYIEQEQISRLKKLASFQIKILNHSMKFPNVKYVSYSTCSIFMTENEYVVNKVLEMNPSFELTDLSKYVPEDCFHKGITNNTEASLRVCRKCHNSDGFYVAIFKRK
jgi:25S rRNA (cytosine2278-C5)-methyltransferase